MNPGFGAQFEGMTDREILISLYKDIVALREKVEKINCPSPRCVSHAEKLEELAERVLTIENTETITHRSKEDELKIIALILGTISGWGGLLIALIKLFWG